MKWLILFFYLAFFSACNLREREEALDKKTAELAQKEQELLLREKAIQLKEEELNRLQMQFDSTSKQVLTDSLALLHPQLAGNWQVNMTCRETTCPGFAVGDTKSEQWEFSFQNNTIIAKAKSNNTLIRVYTGSYNGNAVELTAEQDSTSASTTGMTVRLQQTGDKAMEGQREINRVEGCRIVYELSLDKK